MQRSASARSERGASSGNSRRRFRMATWWMTCARRRAVSHRVRGIYRAYATLARCKAAGAGAAQPLRAGRAGLAVRGGRRRPTVGAHAQATRAGQRHPGPSTRPHVQGAGHAAPRRWRACAWFIPAKAALPVMSSKSSTENAHTSAPCKRSPRVSAPSRARRQGSAHGRARSTKCAADRHAAARCSMCCERSQAVHARRQAPAGGGGRAPC